ncbi:MAG: hypothetical protein AUI02_02960 [Acidobacteria bacterium 13_2_20CM_2_57_12]|nr:MAG: hypothetical protein AUI02_02960 [Acidobacteria bacterium 13_2_20CM_2_57_12]
MFTAMSRSWKILSLTVLATLLIAAGSLLVERKLLGPAGGSAEISLSDLKKDPPPEPGEPPKVAWIEPNMSHAKRQAFLESHFKIVRTMSALSPAVVKVFTVKSGTHLAMTEPGKNFQETDVSKDPDLPRRRLIFAGVSEERVFVHYEMGGIGRSFVVDFFELKSGEAAVGLWEGYCHGPAKNLDDLQRRIAHAGCS